MSGAMWGVGAAARAGCAARVILIPSSVRVWLSTGTTDMRRGMNSLALPVKQALEWDPHPDDIGVSAASGAT